MARIETRREVVSSIPTEEATHRLLRAFTARQADMAHVADGYLEGRVGSQVALRLKGGWLSKLDDFPVVAAVAIAAHGSGSIVRITVADDLGFGLKAGVTRKYTAAVEAFAAYLADSLTPRS